MISVVVPTYNNQDTIERSLMSVACQTYHDWQIVVVNDCSTDHTIDVVQVKFKQYYGDKIKIVNNEKNMGVGISRKIGVDNADGEFVIFLDSDDTLLPNCLEVSKQLQEQHNSDVVYTGTIIYVDDDTIQKLEVDDFIMDGKISPALHLNYPKKWLTGKMFRTELLKKTPMSEKRIGEDVNTLFFACYLANKVRSSKYCGYIHIYRPKSLIGIETKDNIFHLYCESALVDIEIVDFLKEHGNDQELIDKILAIPKLNFADHKQKIESGVIDHKYVEADLLKWQSICNFFENLK